jgi:molybdopterin converting factor small subunit
VKLTFKLYATLAQLLPPEARDHAIQIDVAEGTSAFDVIDRFRVPRASAHLVLVNGVYLEPEQRGQATLKDGDILAIWPPVAGG